MLSFTILFEKYFHPISSLIFVTTGSTIEINLSVKFNELNDFNYELNPDGTGYTLTKITDENFVGDTMEIPTQHNGLPVTKVTARPSLKKVKELVVPAGITITSSSFANSTSLQKVTLAEGITRIESGMFSGCTNLSDVTLPSSIEYIGSNAFSKTAIKTITIPKGTISSEAFTDCELLEEIYIGQNVTNISSGFAKNCYNLKKLVVDENNSTYNSSTRNDYILQTATGTLVQAISTTQLDNNVIIIKAGSFSNGCPETITIPRTLTQIEYNGRFNFTTVYIEDLKAWLNISFNMSGNTASNPLDNAEYVYINNQAIGIGYTVDNFITSTAAGTGKNEAIRRL